MWMGLSYYCSSWSDMSIPVMSILYGVGGITCCGCGKSFVHTGTGGISKSKWFENMYTCIWMYTCFDHHNQDNYLGV